MGDTPLSESHQHDDRQPDSRVQKFLRSSEMGQSVGCLRCALAPEIALSRMPGAGITPGGVESSDTLSGSTDGR